MLVVSLSIAISLMSLTAVGWLLWSQQHSSKHLAAITYRAAVAEKALADQGMLANEVAHELKNPVTAIVCAAQTLEMLLDPQLDSGQRSALRHIKEQGEYVLKIMHDFIDITRGTCGYLQSIKQPTSASDSARSVVGILDSMACKKKISLQFEGPSEELLISVDQKHLKQILFNVTHNAIKFTPTGGRVTVAVGLGSAGGSADCSTVCISVKDSGHGIEKKRLATVCDAKENFKNPSRSEDGCGLGLPLTKTLVDIEGGEFHIASEPGVGTEILILFQRVEPSELVADNALLTELSRHSLVGQRVLVVDNHEGVRESMSELIRALGGIVDGVGEAVQALEAVHHTAYSTVVIDEYVGGLTAAEIAALIRKEVSTGQPRIVVAGGSNQELVWEDGQPVGQTLEKPFDASVLITTLSERS